MYAHNHMCHSSYSGLLTHLDFTDLFYYSHRDYQRSAEISSQSKYIYLFADNCSGVNKTLQKKNHMHSKNAFM